MSKSNTKSKLKRTPNFFEIEPLEPRLLMAAVK
ncbi:LEPR-XLL domain-containing protein [Fibrobacter sp. UWOV1]